jgi:Holliday junction resolvase RusA-like endonuclease
MKLLFQLDTDIDLVSVNEKYCNRSYTLSPAYRSFKAELNTRATMEYWKRGRKMPSQRQLLVTMNAATGKDIDNIVKPTFDALQGVVFKNDSQIQHIDIQRIVKVGKQERIEIKIYEVE